MKRINTNKIVALLLGVLTLESLPNLLNSPTVLQQMAANESGYANLSTHDELVGGRREERETNGVEYETRSDDRRMELSESRYEMLNTPAIPQLDGSIPRCPTREQGVQSFGSGPNLVTYRPQSLFRATPLGRYFRFRPEGIRGANSRDMRTEFTMNQVGRSCNRRVGPDATGTTVYYYEVTVTSDIEGASTCNRQASTEANNQQEMEAGIRDLTNQVSDCMLGLALHRAEESVRQRFARDIETCQATWAEDEKNPLAGIIRFNTRSRGSGLSGSGRTNRVSDVSSRYPRRTGGNSSTTADTNSSGSDDLLAQAQCFIERMSDSPVSSRTRTAFERFLSTLDAMLNRSSRTDQAQALAALEEINNAGLEGRNGARAAAMTEAIVARDRMAQIFRQRCDTHPGNLYTCPPELGQELLGYCNQDFTTGQMECDGGLLGVIQDDFNIARTEFRGSGSTFNQYLGRVVQEAQVIVQDPTAYARFLNPQGGPIVSPSEMGEAIDRIGRTVRSSGGGSAPRTLPAVTGAAPSGAPTPRRAI